MNGENLRSIENIRTSLAGIESDGETTWAGSLG